MRKQHPLQKYLYRNKERVKHLCDVLGVAEGTLRQLPYDTELSVNKALAMEVATSGLVPASSVSSQVEEAMILAQRVFAARAARQLQGWNAGEDKDG